MNSTSWIRPAWTPVTIAAMIVGFAAWWPLGMAVIAYVLWGDRFEGVTRDLNRAAERVVTGVRRASPTASARTGNAAFDEWREQELARLAEERRKLDDMREEFDGYMRELRRARDREEFERFMAERRAQAKKDNGSDVGLETA